MLGAVEVLVIGFPGNKFKGEIIPALKEVVDKGLVRIIDLVFIQKDSSGQVRTKELKDVEPALVRNFDPVLSEVMGLISEKDLEKLADEIENNSSAGILVIEHLWSKKVKEAILRADGKLIEDLHIPHEVVEKAEEASKTLVKA
jgi:uncharacterized membrane protein